MSRGRTIRAALLALAGPLLALTGCAANGSAPDPAGAMPPGSPSPATNPALAAANVAGKPPGGLALVGLEAGQLDRLLGQPELVMNAGPAQWWRYPLGDCVIEVFLIETSEQGRPRQEVSHVRIHRLSDTTAEASLPSCATLQAKLREAGRTAAPPQGL
jgi:hypothetical protein